MRKNLIYFIYCKLNRNKVLKETKMDDENLIDKTGKSIVILEEMEVGMLQQVKQIESEFNYLISSSIRKYIGDIIYKLMKENEKITEEQVSNALGWFVNAAYRDMLKEIKDWVSKNKKELIINISNVIKNYIDINKDEKSDLVDHEINKAMDKCMHIYIAKIKELIYNEIKLLKEEINKSIGGQLVLTNKEFEANSINIVVLEKKLKKYTNEIMNDFAVQSRSQLNVILEDISEDFKELKKDFSNRKINNEINKILDDLKEIYDNSIQKSVDGTLEVAKELNKLNVSNYEIVKNKEIKMKFEEAFSVAESEIDIISPEINNNFRIHNFVKQVIRRGISVKILYGINENDKSNGRSSKSVQKLKKDFQEYGRGFRIKKGGHNSKILICDNKFAIIGNYNFLSFGHEGENDIRDEIAAVTTDPVTINKIRTKVFNF